MKKLIFSALIAFFMSCAPKSPKFNILSFSTPDSIRIVDPDGNPDNSWLGASDTVVHYDSIRISASISYEGPADCYLTELIYSVKVGEQKVQTHSSIVYPPIPFTDGQQRNINFYLYFDNKTAYKVDSLYDDTLNYFGISKIEFYLSGATYEQFFRSDKFIFDLKFVP